jgi:hypothetical protein
VLSFKKGQNGELIWWGLHLKKVFYMGVQKKNWFGKVLRGVSENK